MIVFHNQAQLLSGTMAQRPAHVEQPARQSPADRPREHSEFQPRSLSPLLFTTS
jgi:hypothetical protein